MTDSAVRRGYYFLVIHLPREAYLDVGSLGRFHFAPGYYIYIGSAQGGLDQRVSRHLRDDKTMRWHIDYLLQKAQVVDTLLFETPDQAAEQALRGKLLKALGGNGADRDLAALPTECLLARSVADQHNAAVPAPGFGSSDCRCTTHLYFIGHATDSLNASLH